MHPPELAIVVVRVLPVVCHICVMEGHLATYLLTRTLLRGAVKGTGVHVAHRSRFRHGAELSSFILVLFIEGTALELVVLALAGIGLGMLFLLHELEGVHLIRAQVADDIALT